MIEPSHSLSQEQFQIQVLLKLDYLTRELDEMRDELKLLSSQHNGHSTRITILETDIKNFRIFIHWLAGILASAIAAVAASLGFNWLDRP